MLDTNVRSATAHYKTKREEGLLQHVTPPFQGRPQFLEHLLRQVFFVPLTSAVLLPYLAVRTLVIHLELTYHPLLQFSLEFLHVRARLAIDRHKMYVKNKVGVRRNFAAPCSVKASPDRKMRWTEKLNTLP